MDRIKFGYACEMAPFVSAGLLVKSKKPSLGSRTYGGAQLVGAGIFGTIIGGLVVSLQKKDYIERVNNNANLKVLHGFQFSIKVFIICNKSDDHQDCITAF